MRILTRSNYVVCNRNPGRHLLTWTLQTEALLYSSFTAHYGASLLFGMNTARRQSDSSRKLRQTKHENDFRAGNDLAHCVLLLNVSIGHCASAFLKLVRRFQALTSLPRRRNSRPAGDLGTTLHVVSISRTQN